MAKPSCNFLSDTLREHYHDHGITGIESYIQKESQNNNHIKSVDTKLPAQQGLRYIRLNPRYDAAETLALLEEEIKEQCGSKCSLLNEVTWMPSILGYYAISESFSLSRSMAFRNGRIYGMDVSSGAAVAALLLDDDTNATENVTVVSSKVQIGNDPTSSSSSTTTTTTACNVMRILDLCCAPGLKTCAIVDILSTVLNIRAHVVGIDISEKRLQLCKNVITKYHMDPITCGTNQIYALNDTTVSQDSSNVTIQLFQTDGRTFGIRKYQERDSNALMFDSSVTLELIKSSGSRKRMNKSAKAREQKRLKAITAKNIFDRTLDNEDALKQDKKDEEIITPLFDRVLVDAECSTDGAIRHLRHKYKRLSTYNNSDDNLEENTKLTDSLKLKELVELQQSLISSGFRLLKAGGILVYSTCSLAQEQNEDVISWLLNEYGDSVEVVPALPSLLQRKGVHDGAVEEGSSLVGMPDNIIAGGIKGTLRFHPLIHDECIGGSSGFFLAKLRKKKATL